MQSNTPTHDILKCQENKKLLDLFLPTEKVLWSGTVVKVNKLNSRQKRNIVITTESLYNIRPDNVINKTINFFNKDFAIKRRISLESIKSITYARLGNEFVINVPDEFDYRIVSPLKDTIIESIMSGLKSVGVVNMTFFFTDDIE